MSSYLRQVNNRIRFVLIVLLAPIGLQAQCDIFKSEMEGVNTHVMHLSHLVDSLRTSAESAAFTTQLKTARSNTAAVEILMGQAVEAAYESTSTASEAQYYSEICGITEVKTSAIDAESFSIDARDFIDEAYANVLKAHNAKNLADIHYYMRKAQVASKEAQKSAYDAANASSISFYSCHHNDSAVMAGDE